MGICLDTASTAANIVGHSRSKLEQGNGSQVFEGQQGRNTWNPDNPQEFRYTSTPPDGQLPMHNGGNVQFEPPKVPVIFVLGGPGSGKVTHCDNLMQEKRGLAHINMTDLLQQYAIGNDMQDFGQLSSKTVTEVLMLEMKMAPNAKTYLVSGYPRSMRDVVEYSEKIQVVNGVILVSWRQKVLERQIDYGAKLGQVVLSLAKMELDNFYKNVMPVADYFDQSGMLISVNGERHPGDVYKDFRAAVMRILGMQDNPPALTNGRVATITADAEPVVDRLTDPSSRNVAPPKLLAAAAPTKSLVAAPPPPPPGNSSSDVITVRALDTPAFNSPVKPGWPPIIWVIGGPGSNKATLCATAVNQGPNWVHVSVGRLLRAAAEAPDAHIVRQSISVGEMVPPNIIMQMLETHMAANMTAAGIVIDGYPRDLKQANEFEVKFKQKPTIVLLDCSKLQLGRGRLDDSVSAFRRRLELFRELSLPMLKSMDNDGRLTIVDGDTDSPQVQEDFNRVIRQHMEELQQNPPTRPIGNQALMNGGLQRRNTMVEDLTAVTGLETISHKVANGGVGVANGIANGYANGMANGGANVLANGKTRAINGFLANGNAAVANGAAAFTKAAAPARNQVADMYTNVANQRRGAYNELDAFNVNHI